MDNRLNSIYENYDKLKIGVDERFQFHCRMCGRCCINRDDILLNLKDIFSMSKALKLKPAEMIRRYCEAYIGSSSRIPIVRLKPQGKDNRCPLLEGNRCAVHTSKPTVCAMFPIGRTIQIDDGEKKTEAGAAGIKYIFVRPNCGDKRETHTVREWLEKFGIPPEDDSFVKWQQTIAALGQNIHALEKICEKEAMSTVWDVIYFALYLNYETEKDFMPQFAENSKQIVALIEGIKNADGEV